MAYDELTTVAPAFTGMANRMIYCTLSTVDRRGRPRARIVHTLWEWDGQALVGWVGSMVTPTKRAHLANNPYVSCNFWDGAEVYDTCVAECRAELLLDEAAAVRAGNGSRRCRRRSATTRAPSASPGGTTRPPRHGACCGSSHGGCALSR